MNVETTDELWVEDVIARPPSTKRMLGRALLLRCPRCGSASQFRRWVTRRDHCPGCGYTMEHRPDFFFGAYILNLIVTLLALFSLLISVVIFEATGTEPPLVPLIAIGVVISTVLPVVAYPFSFTVWAVVDLATEPLELSEIAGALDRMHEDRAEREAALEHQHA